VFQTHPGAPRVLIANALLVPAWATWENFRDLEQRGLTMYGQMTAGSWIYIGSQGIVQGTYETLAEIARRHFGGTLSGRLVVTAGLGGMGGAQPLAATMNGAAALVVPARVTDTLDFTGRSAAALPKTVASPRSVDWQSLPRLVRQIGADALPVPTLQEPTTAPPCTSSMRNVLRCTRTRYGVPALRTSPVRSQPAIAPQHEPLSPPRGPSRKKQSVPKASIRPRSAF
jgi:hypothetical protein